jgi:hypothetical protein
MTNLRELLGEAIGKYGVQCSETKILAPNAELTELLDKVERYEAALRDLATCNLGSCSISGRQAKDVAKQALHGEAR